MNITGLSENQFYLVTHEKQHNFRVTVTERSKSWGGKNLVSVHGYVEEITSWEWNEESGEYDKPGDFEKYLSFYMKWDECCHINFGEDDSPGYLHLCGKRSWLNHNQLMTELYEWAAKTIPMRL